MVKYIDVPDSRALDRTFAALADPTRRAILARLDGEESVSVSELAHPFAMSLPAIMKHLDVLAEAGLVTRAKTGRTVACRLEAAPIEDAMTWFARYRSFWSDRLDRLAAFVEDASCPTRPPAPPSPASPSRAASRRARKKSSPPGSTRRK